MTNFRRQFNDLAKYGLIAAWLLYAANPALAGNVTADPGDNATADLQQTVIPNDDAAPLELLGATIMPGTAQRLSWSATELFEGVPVSTPVLVVNGASQGPTLCLTAAMHGDELNGI